MSYYEICFKCKELIEISRKRGAVNTAVLHEGHVYCEKCAKKVTSGKRKSA